MDYYKFEIKPLVKSINPHGLLKVIDMEIQFQGEKYGVSRVFPNQAPFESELAYFTRLAVEELEKKLEEVVTRGNGNE